MCACKICTGRTEGDCWNTPDGTGVPDTDFILYVTAYLEDACQSGAQATAGHCVQDDLDRPVAGHANFCPDAIDPSPVGSEEYIHQVFVVLHEMLHALVFSQVSLLCLI